MAQFLTPLSAFSYYKSRGEIMKTENCTEIAEAKRIEMKSGLKEQDEHPPDSGFVVPAGILIGIGVGLLASQLVPGFFIGLGLGLIGSELFSLSKRSREEGCSPTGAANATALLIGAFLVFIGTSIVLVPANVWPYAFAGFLILAGIALLVRGFFRRP
jgi:hypothetical protein